MKRHYRSTPTVADADALAERAHYGQVDKAGNPYIDHPRDNTPRGGC